MKPKDLQTQVFLDSGNPQDTKELSDILGFLDGQTTNPSLVAKHPELAKKLESGQKLTEQELLDEYKNIVTEIRSILQHGSISIEVYADNNTTADDMVEQGLQMNEWIRGAHIKLPVTPEGLNAAETLVKQGINVNMTLVFTQAQAAAVYAATRGAERGQVFVSPFIGRLDDIELDGIDLIQNIQKMYREQGDGHVEVLAASIRSTDHLLYLLKQNVDIITSPRIHLEAWAEHDMPIPGVTMSEELLADQDEYVDSFARRDLQNIEYVALNLEEPWTSFNISHELTNSGLQRFADDWNSLVH